MKTCEVKIVRAFLGCYRRYRELAQLKDEEALKLGEYYETAAGPKAICYDHVPGSRSGGGSDSRLIEILSDQMDADRKAAEYREKTRQIEAFIRSIDDPRRDYLERAYLKGESFRDIAAAEHMDFGAVSHSIDRLLRSVPSSLAESSGLL